MQTQATRYHVVKPFHELFKQVHYPIRSGMSLDNICHKTGLEYEQLKSHGISIKTNRLGAEEGFVDRNVLLRALIREGKPEGFSLRQAPQPLLFASLGMKDEDNIANWFRAIVARLAPLDVACNIFVPTANRETIGSITSNNRIVEWVQGMQTGSMPEVLSMLVRIVSTSASPIDHQDILRSMARRFGTGDANDKWVAEAISAVKAQDEKREVLISTDPRDMFLTDEDPFDSLPLQLRGALKDIVGH